MSSAGRFKSKSLNRIEGKLESLEAGSLRYQALDACRRFKTSWMDLGQVLFTVHQDKGYRDWGFLTFEGYCIKELGIRQATAAKLLRSYAFLEKEEPDLLRAMPVSEGDDRKIPDLESVHLLRLAKKNARIDETGFATLRKKVIEEGKEPQDVRKEVRFLIDTSAAQDPAQVRGDRRSQYLRKVLARLNEAFKEGATSHFLPPDILSHIEKLTHKIERQIQLISKEVR